MKKIFLPSISIFIFLISFSCKKETGPQGPAGTNGSSGNVPTGNISGQITQNDQYYGTYTTGLNTTKVSLDGTSNSTITDVAGNYTLTNVEPGIYSLSLIKNGCGLTKHEQVIFPGNGTLYLNSSIADKASYVFTSCNIKDTTSQIKVNVSATPFNTPRYGLIIAGKTNTIDINNPASYDFLSTFIIDPNTSSYSSLGSYSDLGVNKFPSGSTIYLKVYPNNSSNTNYIDHVNNRTVYTGYGNAFPVTFTLTMP